MQFFGHIKQFLAVGRPPTSDRRKETALREAIDMVVAGTDPRIRGVRNYGKKLKPAVEKMLEYLGGCSNWLADPIEMSAPAWSANPLVRALFATPAELRQLFSRNKPLRNFFHDHPECTEAYVGLGVTRHERKSFGVELDGDNIQREVEQTLVNFTDYSVFGACGSESELREHVVRRGFGFLVAEALEQVIARQTEKLSLQEEQLMLNLKLKALEHKQRSAESLVNVPPAFDAEIERLRERVTQCQQAYGEAQATLSSLEDYIEHINSVLGAPERYLRQEHVTLYLNRMNIKTDASDQAATPIILSEVTIGHHPPRVVVLCRFPRAELLPEQRFSTEAERLLGLAAPENAH